MIFDNKSLPKDSGATDFMDSARLAGLLAVFGHEKTPDLSLYVIGDLAVRHPNEGSNPGEMPSNNPKNFTRDQLMCLAAGLKAQGREDICYTLYEAARDRNYRAQNTEADVPGSTKKFPNGADFLSPGHMLVLAKCAGLRGNMLGYPWLILDIIFNAIFSPERESNQLLCILKVMGPNWVKFYKKVTPKWAKAIQDYWSGWRNEPELAKFLMEKLH